MCHTMDSQAHTIGKGIRPLFADPVTNVCRMLGMCKDIIVLLPYSSYSGLHQIFPSQKIGISAIL